MLEDLDSKCTAALALFELSAAFDVIDHGIFQKDVEYFVGVTGSVLLCILSYFNGIIQCVAEGKCLK